MKVKLYTCRLGYPDLPLLAACDIKLQTLRISGFHFHSLFGDCADVTHCLTLVTITVDVCFFSLPKLSP